MLSFVVITQSRLAAGVRRQAFDGLDQRAADPAKGLGGVKGEDLAVLLAEHEREHAHQCAVALGDECRMLQRVLEPAEPRHAQGGMLVEEGLNGVVVALLAAPDAEVGRRQAGRARSTIASASTDGGSIP